MKTIKYSGLLLVMIVVCNCGYSQEHFNALQNKVPDSSAILPSDTSKIKTDTIATIIHPAIKSYKSIVDSLLSVNQYINGEDTPVNFISEKREFAGKEFLFYTLCGLVLILGIFKVVYTGYFNNLFRVFFNTSIRQNQLTDQLLQAKLPSFILNIFFALSAGFYIWVLFKNYHPPRLISDQLLLPFCILGMGMLYFVKYCILKFIGWMSGMQQAAGDYIFVIFLVNKIAGIVLLPLIILIAFSLPSLVNYVTTFSLLMLGLFFLSRYVKTYGVLEYKFPLEPLHLIIYITAVEIIPLLILYKLVVDYLI